MSQTIYVAEVDAVVGSVAITDTKVGRTRYMRPATANEVGLWRKGSQYAPFELWVENSDPAAHDAQHPNHWRRIWKLL